MINPEDNYTLFESDIIRGNPGIAIVKKDFLDFMKIKYIDVQDHQQFRVIDVDLKLAIDLYEVKNSYRDNGIIIIEENTNINPVYGTITLGWLYVSKADHFMFVSPKTRTIIIVPNDSRFKEHYEKIKSNYLLEYNKPTKRESRKEWQSSFRRIPLSALNSFYSVYRRVNQVWQLDLNL